MAAESAGALVGAEMGHTGLPWRADLHDELLRELLGPPQPVGPPRRLAELTAEINAAFGTRGLHPDSPAEVVRAQISGLKQRLARYGLAEDVALWSWFGVPLGEAARGCLDLDAAAEADLLLNVEYYAPAEVVGAVNSGKNVVMHTRATGTQTLVAGHVYAVLAATADGVTLYNPWGSTVAVSWSVIAQDGLSFSID